MTYTITITDSPILVTGFPRSGTSVTAGVLHHCGAYVNTKDPLRPPDEHNPTGYFESIGLNVAQACVQISKVSRGRTPRRAYGFDFKKRISEALLDDGYRGGPWLYKSVGISQCIDEWITAFPNAHIIVVRRPKYDAIASNLEIEKCRKLGNALWWCRTYEEYQRHFDHCVEDWGALEWTPGDNIANLSAWAELARWCYLTWNPAAFGHIEPDLWDRKDNGNARPVLAL